MLVICLHPKIPENFMRLILLEEFWFVHISFGSMVKFQFFAQFPVDFLSCLVASDLVLLLCLFAILTYYVINRFESFTS